MSASETYVIECDVPGCKHALVCWTTVWDKAKDLATQQGWVIKFREDLSLSRTSE